MASLKLTTPGTFFVTGWPFLVMVKESDASLV